MGAIPEPPPLAKDDRSLEFHVEVFAVGTGSDGAEKDSKREFTMTRTNKFGRLMSAWCRVTGVSAGDVVFQLEGRDGWLQPHETLGVCGWPVAQNVVRVDAFPTDAHFAPAHAVADADKATAAALAAAAGGDAAPPAEGPDQRSQQTCGAGPAAGAGAGNAACSGMHGVEVDVVCRNVPVVCLNKASDFEENAAWMIQATSDGTGRADSLYEYCNDSDIMSACRKLGLGKDEICIVRLREHKELRAVGTSGKRSTMLACVIALSLADPDGLEDLWAGLRSYKLHRQFYDVMELAKSQCQGAGASAGGSSAGGAKRRAEGQDGGHSTWRAKAARHEEPALEERATSDPYGDYDDYDEPGPVVASKPRAEKGGGSEDYWGSGASRRGGRRGGGGKRAHQRLGPATASALDDQLASYFK